MAEYQKYMFDNFVITTSKKAEEDIPVVEEEVPAEIEAAEVAEDEPTGSDAVLLEDSIVEAEAKPVEHMYTESEFNEAVKAAEATGYEKGKQEAAEAEQNRHNVLLEGVKSQLMTIFAELEEKTARQEVSTIEFAVDLVRKLLPTMEKDRAEAEVKNFLAQNFANFAAQESLSFSFNPEVISLVADSIGRLAEQNDFEGKISVHKDNSLGLSDCRVEWKNGGVERNIEKSLDKVEQMITDSTQERENGE